MLDGKCDSEYFSLQESPGIIGRSKVGCETVRSRRKMQLPLPCPTGTVTQFIVCKVFVSSPDRRVLGFVQLTAEIDPSFQESVRGHKTK